MNRSKMQKNKIMILLCIPLIYMIFAAMMMVAVSTGVIPKNIQPAAEIAANDSLADNSPELMSAHLQSAESFFENNFLRSNGHIDLYFAENQYEGLNDKSTNSEAVSYYLLWKAQSKDKKSFDNELDFITKNMVQPNYGYLMWRLDPDEKATGDGSNIATDADLRAIKALLIAEDQWKDKRYTQLIDQFAAGLEEVGVTKDGYLAPYGGVSGESSTWTANEVWLSYSDFTVFRELAERRGAPWDDIYHNMKDAILEAQISNGLYNSMLTENREYGNGIDAGGYSINSMWIMVRNAESGDQELMESARRSLQFYKDKFAIDGELYSLYGSNGDPLSPTDTPWVYALVGRAAIALDDEIFSEEMIEKLIEHQVNDKNSALFGSFPEGSGNQTRVGQFTMQESIITLWEFNNKK